MRRTKARCSQIWDFIAYVYGGSVEHADVMTEFGHVRNWQERAWAVAGVLRILEIVPYTDPKLLHNGALLAEVLGY